MAEPVRDDIDELAAEYVLGTLDAEELAAAQARVVSDPTFAAAVAEWERRLSPLQQETPTEIPTDALSQSILERYSAAHPSNLARLERQILRWRAGTIAASVAAAVLLVFLMLPIRTATESQFVALLQSNAAAPAFVARVNLSRGIAEIHRIGVEPAHGHSYELWALGAGRKKPQALGIIDASLQIRTAQLGSDPVALRDTTLAVSLEPQGGSPTGLPTGPVLFTGKLVRVD